MKTPTKAFTKWETRARQLVGIASYNNAFVAALHTALQEPGSSEISLQLLLEALNRTSRHALGVSLALSAELTHARREDTLSTCPSLSAEAKRTLRSAPISSKFLFGGRVADVAKTDGSDSIRDAALGAAAATSSAAFKRPNQPRPKKGGGGRQDTKKPRLSSPLMAVHQPSPSRGFQRGRGGRRRGGFPSAKAPGFKPKP